MAFVGYQMKQHGSLFWSWVLPVPSSGTSHQKAEKMEKKAVASLSELAFTYHPTPAK